MISSLMEHLNILLEREIIIVIVEKFLMAPFGLNTATGENFLRNCVRGKVWICRYHPTMLESELFLVSGNHLQTGKLWQTSSECNHKVYCKYYVSHIIF